MQRALTEFVVGQATHDAQKHRFGKAIGKAVEVGVVVPSILRSNLEAAGYRLVTDKETLRKWGFADLSVLTRVVVVDKDDLIIAMGAAGDRDEAILAAALGWCRENALPGADVPEGIATAPVGT